MQYISLCAPLAFAALLTGCASTTIRKPLEDQTRRVAPLPTCVLELEPRGPHSDGTVRPLREPEIVRLLFPAFNDQARPLASDARTCVDTQPFLDPALAPAIPVRGTWPWRAERGDILYGAGGDRLKVVWLRAVHFSDGTFGGPLAIVRGSEQFAEAFGVGVYRGSRDVVLGVARTGSSLLVTAEDDGCANRGPQSPCEKVLTLFLPHMGALQTVAQIPTERIAFEARNERGRSERLEYRLNASVDYRADGIRVLEHVATYDASGATIRKAERERTFLRNTQGVLSPAGTSLWDSRVPPDASDLAGRTGVRR